MEHPCRFRRNKGPGTIRQKDHVARASAHGELRDASVECCVNDKDFTPGLAGHINQFRIRHQPHPLRLLLHWDDMLNFAAGHVYDADGGDVFVGNEKPGPVGAHSELFRV